MFIYLGDKEGTEESEREQHHQETERKSLPTAVFHNG
jgi:hypothetical protein